MEQLLHFIKTIAPPTILALLGVLGIIALAAWSTRWGHAPRVFRIEFKSRHSKNPKSEGSEAEKLLLQRALEYLGNFDVEKTVDVPKVVVGPDIVVVPKTEKAQ